MGYFLFFLSFFVKPQINLNHKKKDITFQSEPLIVDRLKLCLEYAFEELVCICICILAKMHIYFS